MPKIILMEMDIWGALVRAAKPKGIKGKPVPFTVSLDVDSKAYGAVSKDALLQAKITEAASGKYNTYVKAMAPLLKKYDAAYLKAKSKKDAAKILAGFEAKFKAGTKALAANAQKAAQKAWEDVQKTKEEYREYQIKAGVGLAIDGISLAGGVIGAVGTGGFGLIVALYGIIKSLVTITMKLYKLALDADKMQKRVTKGLKEVQKSYDKKRKEHD